MRWVLLSALLLTGCQSEKEKAFRLAAADIVQKASVYIESVGARPDSATRYSEQLREDIEQLPDVRDTRSLQSIRNDLVEVRKLFLKFGEDVRSAKEEIDGARRDEWVNFASNDLARIKDHLQNATTALNN